MTDHPLSYIFGPELYGRLRWFTRLRWLAVSALALAALLGPRLGFPSVWPSFFVVASVVAAYNLALRRVLRGRQRSEHPYANLRAITICVTVMDLAALLVTVHFSGGLRSPLLPFFVFHMAIGTIMIATRTTYMLAGATSFGALVLYLLESSGVLAVHPIDALGAAEGPAALLNLLTLVVALFGVVYLTDSVTSRFKQRNIDLYEATEALSERTEELQRLLQKLERVEQRKSHYMRISAHQLRSPVGTIKASLQVLLDGYVDPSTNRGRKLLRGAAERAEGLLAIINDLLDLAKIREGRAGKAPWSRRINVNQLLADLFDSLQPSAEKLGVKLVPDFEGIAVLDRGIPPDLVHAFENLIYNAIKYSLPEGRVTVSLRIRDEAAVVSVHDEGIGIPEAYLDQIFLEFVRAPNAKGHRAEGTGLGLAIVREVVQEHGGTVSARGGERGGSVFTVSLPLRHGPGGSPVQDPAVTVR
jgi:signal transduction histidine kinase